MSYVNTLTPLTFGVGGGIAFGEIAGELDVGAVPEHVAVFPGLMAHATAQFDPVFFVGGALASPRGGVELVVPRVFAALARVCQTLIGFKAWGRVN